MPEKSAWFYAYCKVQSLDPNVVTEDYCERMARYAFLSSTGLRTDSEQKEAEKLASEFSEITGWPLMPREVI